MKKPKPKKKEEAPKEVFDILRRIVRVPPVKQKALVGKRLIRKKRG